MMQLVSTSPEFPVAWTEDVAKAARDHAAERYPEEAAGYVSGGKYVRVPNLSAQPTFEVGVANADAIAIADADLFFHSHPGGPGTPSESDMRYQMQLGIPFVTVTWPEGDTFCWGDTLKPAPLIGRAFRHGVHDCYSLARDWYRANMGVELPQFARGWEWWLKGQTLYLDGFEQAGFRQIPLGEATKVGDALLFKFRYATPMHAALVAGPDLLVHHIAGARPYDPTRLSGNVPRSRWARHATMALRYGQ